MLVGIHQPHYLPWLRYFEKIAHCDTFIVLDTVQFSKNGWQNRNKIKSPAGATLLTAPVRASLDQALYEVRLDTNAPWLKKHHRSIEQNYRKAPHFAEHQAFLKEVYSREWSHLAELNRCMLEYFVKALGIDTPIAYASELDVPGAATERLVNLVKAVGGDAYYSGAFALEAYLDAATLEAAGIRLELQKWQAPEYPQLHGAFIPDLSIVDLLMNCGPASLEVISHDQT
jgi:WbqC-like protein